MTEFIQIGLLAALVALLVTAAVGDIRRYIIPNTLCLVIAGLSLPYWVATCTLSGQSILLTIGIQIALALLVFAGFAVLFAMGAMGGGDVKLMAALALWVPGLQLLKLLFLVALYGGLVALVIVIVRRWRGDTNRAVPYGVAIAAGGITLTVEPIVKFLSL